MRPSWPDYFLRIAQVVATRGTCDRKQVGAVIADENNRIISTGYNGVPSGLSHCDDVGHTIANIDGRDSCIATLHAESNAIDAADPLRMHGGVLYVTVTPCYECAKRIINSGIKKVYFSEYYESRKTSLVQELMQSADVALLDWS
jgi:dCMP deaminase